MKKFFETMNVYEQLKRYLESIGAINIREYSLVNNWGYSYDLDDEHYDSRFWANCYGVSFNRFETMPTNYSDKTKDVSKIIDDQLNKIYYSQEA